MKVVANEDEMVQMISGTQSVGLSDGRFEIITYVITLKLSTFLGKKKVQKIKN